MSRKCSHCGNIGHNSRTCTTTYNAYTRTAGHQGTPQPPPAQHGHCGLRLFGGQVLTDMTSSSSHHSSQHMKKSFSMNCLSVSSSINSSNNNYNSLSRISSIDEICVERDSSAKYLASSEGHYMTHHETKKGVAWSEEEHMAFLIGLEKLGRGDWRGIARKYVTTRTPTQVASHAQKYFLRIATLDSKKRRSSLFDMQHFLHYNGPQFSKRMYSQNSSRSVTASSSFLPDKKAAPPFEYIDLNSSDTHQHSYYGNETATEMAMACSKNAVGQIATTTEVVHDLELTLGHKKPPSPLNYIDIH